MVKAVNEELVNFHDDEDESCNEEEVGKMEEWD